MVGARLGLRVGPVVDIVDGILEGTVVGARLGLRVGPVVGIIDGKQE